MTASTGPSLAVSLRTSIVEGRSWPLTSATMPSVSVNGPASVFQVVSSVTVSGR